VTARRDSLMSTAGMTLVDLLVASAVLALFLLITDRVFLSVHLASRTTQQAADMQQNARAAAVRFRREIREARAPVIQCHPDPACATPSTQVAFSSARPSDAASTFCLDVAPADPSRARLESVCATTPIPMTGTYAPVWQRTIGYHLSAGDLRRVAQAGALSLPLLPSSGQIVASQVSSFTVTVAGARVRLRIESFSSAGGGAGGTVPQQMQLQDTIQLRNLIIRPSV
jgi:Tfp pilus assembly protein PilE